MKTEIKDFTGVDGFRNYAWRIQFENGVWTGWHKGYHSGLDAENAAKHAMQ